MINRKRKPTPPDALQGVIRAIFLISLPFGILHFALPIYGRSIGADALQIGLFFSAFSIMTVLLRPIVGVGLDRYGRKPFFVLGVLIYAASMFMFAGIDDVWGIVVARLTQGIASSFLWLSASAITADVSRSDKRGYSFGRVEQSASQGAILGTFIGFAVLLGLIDAISGTSDDSFATRWFLLFGFFGVVGLYAAFRAWRHIVETAPEVQDRENQAINWSRTWILLLMVTIVTASAWSMVSPIIMIYLQEKLAAGIYELALAYLPAALVGALLPSRLGVMADRFGRKPMMVASMAVAAVGSFVIPALNSLVALSALWGLQALSFAAGDPAEKALVSDITGSDQRGRAYGIYLMAAGIGATVGPLLGGWLYKNIAPEVPFYINGVILTFSLVILGVFLKETHTV